MSFFTAALFS